MRIPVWTPGAAVKTGHDQFLAKAGSNDHQCVHHPHAAAIRRSAYVLLVAPELALRPSARGGRAREGIAMTEPVTVSERDLPALLGIVRDHRSARRYVEARS